MASAHLDTEEEEHENETESFRGMVKRRPDVEHLFNFPGGVSMAADKDKDDSDIAKRISASAKVLNEILWRLRTKPFQTKSCATQSASI